MDRGLSSLCFGPCGGNTDPAGNIKDFKIYNHSLSDGDKLYSEPPPDTDNVLKLFTENLSTACSGKNELCDPSWGDCADAHGSLNACASLCAADPTCVSFEYGIIDDDNAGNCQASTTCSRPLSEENDAWNLYVRKPDTTPPTIVSIESAGSLGLYGRYSYRISY